MQAACVRASCLVVLLTGCGSATIGALADGAVADTLGTADGHATRDGAADVSATDVLDGAPPDVATPADVGCGEGCDAGTTDTGIPSCPDLSERGCGEVTIPGGTFTLGGDTVAQGDVPAAGTVTVSSFALDAYEVTVARFRRFWAVGHPATHSPLRYPGGALTWTGGNVSEPNFSNGLCTWTEAPGVLEAHPITCVDWYTAQSFCVWDNGRLPTEAEWEYSARGWTTGGLATGRSYPWGGQDPVMCDRAQWDNCAGDDGTNTRRVGSFAPAGGLYDLAGNVSEWTADWFSTYVDPMCWDGTTATDPVCNNPGDGVHGFRGGAFDSAADALLRGASRAAAVPEDSNVNGGFRCVRRPP